VWLGVPAMTEDSKCVIAHYPGVCDLLVVSSFSKLMKGLGDDRWSHDEA